MYATVGAKNVAGIWQGAQDSGGISALKRYHNTAPERLRRKPSRPASLKRSGVLWTCPLELEPPTLRFRFASKPVQNWFVCSRFVLLERTYPFGCVTYLVKSLFYNPFCVAFLHQNRGLMAESSHSCTYFHNPADASHLPLRAL